MAGVRPITDIFLPYVLEMPGEVEEDGMSLAMVLCVVRKESGVLLAAPNNFFLAEVLEAGQIAGPDDLVGPSVLMHVPGGRLDQMNGSPPVAAPDAWVDVIVVDMSPDILDQLTPVAEHDGPTELLHIFDTDPFVYPLRDDLVSMTWDWLVQPSSVERIQYYSAGEEEQEEEELVPETVAAAPLPHALPAGPKAAGLPIGAGKGQKPRSPPKAKKPSVASLATSFESVMAVLPALTNQIAELNQRTKTMEERMQEPGRLSALSRPLGDSASSHSVERDAPSVEPPEVETTFKGGRPCGDGDGSPGRREKWGVGWRRHDPSYVCPVYGDNCFGCPDCKYERRPYGGACKFLHGILEQGCCREDEASTGVGCSERDFLLCGRGQYGEEDAPSYEAGGNTNAAGWTRHHDVEVRRTFRRLRSGPGFWSCDVASGLDHGSFADGELAGSNGCHGPPSGLLRTDGIGWFNGCGSLVVSQRGPAERGVHEPLPGSPVTGESICTVGISTMDCSCTLLHQRTRPDHPEACGLDRRKDSTCWRFGGPKGKTKAPAEMEEEEERPGGCRGGLNLGAPSARVDAGEGACPRDRCCLDLADTRAGGSRRARKRQAFRDARKHEEEKLAASRASFSRLKSSIPGGTAEEDIPQTITFQHLAASMPRLILKTKTKFAAYLAKTFHLQCGGSAPSSVVFPLPLPELCLFRGGGPKMSRRRWQTLLRKRLLHLVVVALNFLHDGFRESDIWQLGRRPNALQKKVHHRLWSLITTCDSPGMFPLSPGRSGDEFIARLHSLEAFAKSCPLLSAEMYEEGPDDLSKEAQEVNLPPPNRTRAGGKEGESLGVYRPLDVSRLKLTGRAQWDLANHLDDELWLPYVEPAVLRHGLERPGVEGPNFAKEDKDENLKLAKLWSTQGLLCLAHQQPVGGLVSRVFNNLKNEHFDRQIGDRRLMNGGERSIQGPSRYLPGGYLMTSLHVAPGCRLVGAVTDRKDFYHQAKVTRQRAESNCLPFGYPTVGFRW